MATITVGTFNLNNLFSRFNFRADITAKPEIEVSVTFDITDPSAYQVRTYKGQLVKGKPAAERQLIASRIKTMDLDVLAAQEVEDVDTLRAFVRDDLAGMYPYLVLVEGNDPRLIDLAVLSKYPIGAVTSWQHAVHPAMPSEPVFSRDLLEVEIFNAARNRKLFTFYNNHLKSHYIPPEEDPVAGTAAANARRLQQAEIISQIVQSRMRPSSAFVILGDMNDPPNSQYLSPFTTGTLGVVDGLAAPTETRPPKVDNPMPASAAWTHRYKESGKPAHYELFDHIWLSPSLAARLTGSWIDRRTKHGGDGSDHDPAWVQLAL